MLFICKDARIEDGSTTTITLFAIGHEIDGRWCRGLKIPYILGRETYKNEEGHFSFDTGDGWVRKAIEQAEDVDDDFLVSFHITVEFKDELLPFISYIPIKKLRCPCRYTETIKMERQE